MKVIKKNYQFNRYWTKKSEKKLSPNRSIITMWTGRCTPLCTCNTNGKKLKALIPSIKLQSH